MKKRHFKSTNPNLRIIVYGEDGKKHTIKFTNGDALITDAEAKALLADERSTQMLYREVPRKNLSAAEIEAQKKAQADAEKRERDNKAEAARREAERKEAEEKRTAEENEALSDAGASSKPPAAPPKGKKGK